MSEPPKRRRFDDWWLPATRVLSFALGAMIVVALVFLIDDVRFDLAFLALVLLGYPAMPALERLAGAMTGATDRRE